MPTQVDPGTGDLSRGTAWKRFACVLVLGLSIRVYLLVTATITSRDTSTFVWYAQALADDPLTALRSHDQHPLYPAMILVMRHTFGRLFAGDGVREWELSAQIVSCMGGLAAIVALYVVSAQLFSRRIALVAAFSLACLSEPCQLSADGLSDMPHLAVYLFATASLIAALRRRSLAHFGWAGGLSGIAFLLRPEGATIAIIGSLLALVVRSRAAIRSRFLAAALCATVFFAACGPYMVATGRLVRKKPLDQFFSAAPAAQGWHARGSWRGHDEYHPIAPEPLRASTRAAFGGPTLSAIWEIAEKYVRGGRVVFVLPMFVGLGFARVRTGDPVGCRVVQAVACFHTLLLVALRTSFGYVSGRHVFLLVVLTLPFSAAALAALVEWTAARQRRPSSTTFNTNRIWGVLLLILFACTAPWTFRPLHADRGYIRRAGEWIRRADFGPDTVVVTTRHRVPFYGRCRFALMLDSGQLDVIGRYIEQHDADLLVIDGERITDPQRNPHFFEDLAALSHPDWQLELLHAEASRPNEAAARILIYRVVRRFARD